MVGLLGLRVRMERGADDEELANANCSGLGERRWALDLAFFLGGDGELPSSLIFFVRDLGMAGVTSFRRSFRSSYTTSSSSDPYSVSPSSSS
jgi:hypothetical protein